MSNATKKGRYLTYLLVGALAGTAGFSLGDYLTGIDLAMGVSESDGGRRIDSPTAPAAAVISDVKEHKSAKY
ncbi:hypothetical protein [Xanthomonas perforans]|uniref:hypothetical protein n=1 Tax=Xanthomonas perforans TaxID=442694 RepID=UPI002359E804|nr:hypothetical protein [Xanthomonas perforans]MDC9654393.1 hypothetical protein [Xanthomonas perforans]MEB2159623.1 hypothetical protein [Xanthomonas campestris pv. campestris]